MTKQSVDGISFDEISQGILKVVRETLKKGGSKGRELSMVKFDFDGTGNGIQLSCFMVVK